MVTLKQILKLNKSQVEEMYKTFTGFESHKQANQIDYMEWGKYPLQFDMRNKILQRVLFKVGNKKIYVVFGGNRSGKTELGAGVVCEVLEKKTPAKIWCATVDYKTSVAVQQSKIQKLLRHSIIKYGKYSPASGYTNQIVVTKKGSTCSFKTYEQGRKAFQGEDLDLVWWDEEGPWDCFQECLARLTDRGGVFLLTFTSLEGFTRLVNFLWESNNPLVESTALSILDNPFIAQKDKDDWLATVDPDELISRRDGVPHLKQGLIYKEFGVIHKIEPFDHVKMAMDDPGRYELHEGIDPHERTPHRWVRFLYDKQKNIIYICDELTAPCESMVIADFARIIKLKRGFRNTGSREFSKRGVIEPMFTQIDTSSMKPDVIYKNPDEDQDETHTVRLEFQRQGIQTILCSKDNAVGLSEVKKRLKTVKTISGTVKRAPLLYVFNTCKGVIWEFSRYAWDSYDSAKISEKNELLNRPRKKDDHYMDIIKYEAIKMQGDYGPVDKEPEYEEQFEGMGY